MNLTINIEGDTKVVRDFINFLRPNKHYACYTHAKYLFSPEIDQVEFAFSRSELGGAKSNEKAR